MESKGKMQVEDQFLASITCERLIIYAAVIVNSGGLRSEPPIRTHRHAALFGLKKMEKKCVHPKKPPYL